MSKMNIGNIDSDYLTVEITGHTYPNCNDYADGNWLNSKIEFSLGPFRGKSTPSLRAEEFYRFHSQIETLHTSLRGTAGYEAMEECLQITMTGDKQGHVKTEIILKDEPGSDNKLSFTMMLDQSHLTSMINDLKAICSQYPVVGK